MFCVIITITYNKVYREGYDILHLSKDSYCMFFQSRCTAVLSSRKLWSCAELTDMCMRVQTTTLWAVMKWLVLLLTKSLLNMQSFQGIYTAQGTITCMSFLQPCLSVAFILKLHRVSKKLCQLIFFSLSVKYELISIKIGRIVTIVPE